MNEVHKIIVVLLILLVIFVLLIRKKDNYLLCEGFKFLFLFFVVILFIISKNLFGETVRMKVITI